MLVTLPGMYILADELPEDIFIDEICEAANMPEGITDFSQAESPNLSEDVKNSSVYLDNDEDAFPSSNPGHFRETIYLNY